ncbi:WG repeat-containing protein [Hymenobacter sp. BT664]|uniref:WG repeat-containing protein n=1 Tax=Hymenobacter montanus TaxID=2771359 RepID=A0A927BH27_9BACT|nr:WG repeat-containing protein [Hymenobacter montanus]MBD2770326.1 WG repeat-containing protein [Hymenobacter montanus]
MLYPVVKEEKYGFINSRGELLVEPIYDLVGRFSEDRCIVEKFPAEGDRLQEYVDYRGQEVVSPTRLQGYIDSSGQEVIALKHTPFCSSFSEGLAQYADAIGQLGFIDQWGEFKIHPQFNIEYEGNVSMSFSEGVTAVATEVGWKYINKEGEELFKDRFETAKRFHDGYALVSQLRQASKTENYVIEDFFFIDKAGHRLETIPCTIGSTNPGFRNGLCQVIFPEAGGIFKDNRIGFLNTDGNLAFEEGFSHSSGFHQGLCIVEKRGGKAGVINTKGEWVIEPLYDNIGLFNYGIAAFQQNQKWGLLNQQGEVILSPRFSFIDSFRGYLSPSEPDSNPEFQDLTVAMIEEPGRKKRKTVEKWYINRAGEIVSPFDLSAG